MADKIATGGWQPGSPGYEGGFQNVFHSETAAIDLALRPDGLVDMVVTSDGDEVMVSGISTAALAEIARKIAAACDEPGLRGSPVAARTFTSWSPRST
jgi:hypothetical protein